MSSGRLQSVSTCFPGEIAPGSLYQPRMGGTTNEAATAPTIAPIIMKTRTVFTLPPAEPGPSYAMEEVEKGTPGDPPAVRRVFRRRATRATRTTVLPIFLH